MLLLGGFPLGAKDVDRKLLDATCGVVVMHVHRHVPRREADMTQLLVEFIEEAGILQLGTVKSRVSFPCYLAADCLGLEVHNSRKVVIVGERVHVV